MKINLFTGVMHSVLTGSDVVVAIDVLRSSTTILTALANGAQNIIPVSTVEEALNIGRNANVMLGGEVASVKPSFFHFGNSPLEYVAEKVRGRTIVLYTSSGSRLLRFLAAVSKKVLVGAIVNVSPLVEYLKRGRFENVSIVTAGKIGSPALEDTYCAGLIARRLPIEECNRDVEIAMRIAELNTDVVKSARHASELVKIGLGGDVEYSLTLDKISLVVQMDPVRGCIRLP